MTEITYREAIIKAIADELDADPDVFLLGEDVGAAGGAFKTTEGLYQQFGGERVFDTPIAEQAIIGCAIGAAVRGLRPIAEIMFADFAGVCFDQIANQLAKYRYMTDGQVALPVTVRMANGAGAGFGAQHSQASENWFLNIAGLKMVAPSTPADVYSLLRAAIRDDDPVLVFEHKALFNNKGELSDDAGEIGVAEVVREGSDVTVVANQLMRHRAIDAASRLEEGGISVEVIDPRTLAPLDCESVAASLGRTNHLVCVQEGHHAGGWASSLVAALVEEHFESLDAPPLVVCGDNTPIPYSGVLEDAWLPSVDRIEQAVRASLAY